MVTTNFVVAQTHALLLARMGRHVARRFILSLPTTSVTVIRATEEDELAATEIILGYTDKDFSLTDAISFAVMRRLGLDTAFSFDRDFLRFGFAQAQP